MPARSARRSRPARLLTAITAFTLVATLASPAGATFPSHNGDIAFRRFLNEDRTWGAVFTVHPDGSGERQVTHPPEGFVDRDPDVSPDGRSIVFQREGELSSEIFVGRADGSGLRRLTHPVPGCLPDTGTCDREPAWTPDGRHVVFSRESGTIAADEENAAIYMMRADGSGLRRLTQLELPGNGFDYDPQVSPDGRRIVFERDNVRDAQPSDGIALWILDLPSGREHRVTPYPLRAGDTPDWSPDGRRILFHDNVAGPSDVSSNLYTIHPDGSGLRQLTFETGGGVNYLGASYSPDGRFISVGRRPETGGTNADVLVMRADGTHIRNITESVLYDSYPDWGPAVDEYDGED